MKFSAVQTLRYQAQSDTRCLILLVIDSFFQFLTGTSGKNPENGGKERIKTSKVAKFESNLLKTNKVAEFYRLLYGGVISLLVLDVSSVINFLILRRPSQQ